MVMGRSSLSEKDYQSMHFSKKKSGLFLFCIQKKLVADQMSVSCRRVCLSISSDSPRTPPGITLVNHLAEMPAIGPSISNDTLKSEENTGAIVFKMAELNRATSNFSPSCKIGQGGFGVIYKGTLSDGRVVAIKRGRKDLFEARMMTQFRSEVNMMAKIDHLNLVKLIGYLEEGNERILVEEYVPNGNLRQHLDCELGAVLDFFTRLEIAIGVSHALTYLHLYADEPIIHRDIKSSNILLTENLRAKVVDFGFSRTGPLESGHTHVVTQVKGTAGYLDPEYLKTYKLTVKTDVYAFGILLVELLSGRRPIEYDRDIDEKVTVRWAYNQFLKGSISGILDPRLERSEVNLHVAKKVLELAFQCSAPTRNDRPTMKETTEYLWMARKEYNTARQ